MTYEDFKINANEVFLKIENACNKLNIKNKPLILPVTKNHPIYALEFAKKYGFKSVGENRVQEANEKSKQIDIPIELIGHLQSNKVNIACECFSRIQSVDSEKLASKIDAKCKSLNKIMPILIEVNTGQDSAKFGLNENNCEKFLTEIITKYKNLEIQGLMCVAPLIENASNQQLKFAAQKAFSKLRILKENLEKNTGVNLFELSMGMSGDFEEAILEGSTMIRIGTAFFGQRNY